MKHITLILSLLILTALTACGQTGTTTGEGQESSLREGSGSYENISVTQLQSMLKSKDFLLINVHIPLAGEILGTDLSIPYNQMEENISQLPENRAAEIVLYCAMGPMSDAAALTLVELGYTGVKTLNGGMMAWERQNLN